MTRPLSITAYGTAQVDTAQSKFGGASLLVNGTSSIGFDNDGTFDIDYTQDFTVEMWVRLTTVPGSSDFDIILDCRDSGNLSTQRFTLYANDSKFKVNLNFSATPRIISNTTISSNTWYHVAVVLDSGVVKLYVDGSLQTQTYNLTNNIILSSDFVLGARADYTGFGMIGNIDEFRWSSVARYTSGFTAPTERFYDDSDTLILLHMDGADSSTTFTDDNSYTARPISVTAYGNAQIDTAQSKFGGASAYFDGSGDYLTAPIRNNDKPFLDGDDFTLEAWVYKTTSQSFDCIFAQWSSLTNNNIFFGLNGLTPTFYYRTNSSTQSNLNASVSISTNTWTHLAVTRDSGTVKIWVDGVERGSATVATLNQSTTNQFRIGQDNQGNPFLGWIDELRISRIPRYTSGFTPSTTAFSNDDDTLLLLHMDGTDGSTTFTDDTSVGVTQEGAADFSGVFTPTITINASRAGDVDLYAAFSQPTVDATRTRTADSTQNLSFTQTADAEVIRDTGAAVNAAFTQADVDAARTRGFDTDLNSAFTQADVESGRIRQGEADLGALFSPSIFAVASRNGSIDAAAQFTFSADADRTRSTSVTLENIVNLSLQSDRIRPGASTLESASTITIAVRKFSGFEFDAAISFDQTATALRIKQIDADLGALFTPNFTAVASLNGSTDLLSSAGISATATRIQEGAASFESAASLSSNSGLLIELDAESYSSSAQLAASPISYTITRPFGRPNNFNAYKKINSSTWGSLNNTIIEYNTDDNFDGTYALSFDTTGEAAIAVITDSPVDFGSDEFMITFVIDKNDDNSFISRGPVMTLFSFGDGFNTYLNPETDDDGIINIGLSVQGNDEDVYLYASWKTGFNTYQYIYTTYDLSSFPVPITLRRSGNTFQLYTFGGLRGSATYTGSIYGTGDTFALYAPEGIQIDFSDPSFDRFYVKQGDSGPNHPSDPVALANDETVVFYHTFEQTQDDILGIKKQFSSAITSQASLTVNGIVSIGGAANLSSAFAQTAQGGIIQIGASDLSSSATITADLGVIKTDTSTIESAATLAVTGNTTKTFDSDLTAAATLLATPSRTRPFDADFEAFYTQLSAVSKIGDFFVNADVVATQTVDANITAGAESEINAIFSQTASFGVFRRTVISLTTVAAQNANINVIAGADTSLNAEFTKTVDLDVFRNFDSSLNSQFALSADTGEITQGASLQLGEFGITVTAEATKPFDAQLESQFEQNTNAIIGVDGAFDATAVFGQTLTAERLRDIQGDFGSITTQITAIGRIASFILEPDVAFGLQAEPTIIPEGQSLLESTSVLTAQVLRIKQLASEIESTVTQTSQAAATLRGTTLLEVNTTLTANSVVTVGITSTPPSEFGLTATVGVIKQADSTLSSTATITADASITASADADLGALFTPSLVAGITRDGSIDLDLAFSLSVLAKVIDPTRIVYTIPSETRSWQIAQESRSHTIHRETRTYTIEEEN